jgi:hypothetical protein
MAKMPTQDDKNTVKTLSSVHLLGIETDDVANYYLPQSSYWPTDREQRARIISNWPKAEVQPKQHYPRPPIEQTVTPEEIGRLHLEVAKEASPAKQDVSPVKHHKPKILARQRNNYERPGYGNALQPACSITAKNGGRI